MILLSVAPRTHAPISRRPSRARATHARDVPERPERSSAFVSPCRSTRVSLGRLSRRARRSTSSTAARARIDRRARARPARGFGDRVAVVVDRAKASASGAATSMSPGGLALALALSRRPAGGRADAAKRAAPSAR